MERDARVQGLFRIGERAIVRDDGSALDAYVAPDFVLHSPSVDIDLPALKAHFGAERAAFDDFAIERGIMVVEGDYIAGQTTFTGVSRRSSPDCRSGHYRRPASPSPNA